MQAEEKTNELLKTLDLAVAFTRPCYHFGLYTSYNVRKPLYLFAKVLLMTRSIEQAEKKFNLSNEQINKMVKKAAQFINKHIQEENKNYKPIAIWLYNLISDQKEEIISDPDTLILTALYKDPDLDPVLKKDFFNSIQSALGVSKTWISNKIIKNTETSNAEKDSIPQKISASTP